MAAPMSNNVTNPSVLITASDALDRWRTNTPSIVPNTKSARIVPTKTTVDILPVTRFTARRVEFPLMKEIKYPPSCKKPMASTYPARADKHIAKLYALLLSVCIFYNPNESAI